MPECFPKWLHLTCDMTFPKHHIVIICYNWTPRKCDKCHSFLQQTHRVLCAMHCAWSRSKRSKESTALDFKFTVLGAPRTLRELCAGWTQAINTNTKLPWLRHREAETGSAPLPIISRALLSSLSSHQASDAVRRAISPLGWEQSSSPSVGGRVSQGGSGWEEEGADEQILPDAPGERSKCSSVYCSRSYHNSFGANHHLAFS